MPKFYFNIRRGERLELDEEGTEFASLEEACAGALEAAREILAEAILTRQSVDGDSFEIASEDGTLLAMIPFSSVIPKG
ncbi:DUF6894 family protein [Rhizobium leguminosarum]|uniref:DUF6894 domain-containing protein n=1 Tax=Rhizobium leguminosarum TaxID=384 RepID=A0A7W9ZMQ5_RHILE|nr:hypothetical protein [Rhizobium leguminosarum]MBB6219530.1 hypothetical protein [Rhizobium leguminosarum]